MATHINDAMHALAGSFISRKYTAHSDDRQKSMGLAYVTAEKEDLISEVANFARSMHQLGRKEVLDAITYTNDDGGIFNAKLDHVDLREFLP